MPSTHKTAKTTRDYATTFKGWAIVVPAGSTVSNKTASGYDDSVRFWTDYNKTAEAATGTKGFSTLKSDLKYYGLNVPAEYCEPYK